MQFSLDQQEFRDLVRRFFAEHISSEYLRSRIAAKQRSDAGLLLTMKQLGLEEGFGGDGAPFSVVELALLASESGRALMPEPIAERLLCQALLARLMPPGERAEYRSKLAGGVAAIAAQECCNLSYDATHHTVSGSITWAFGGEGASRALAFLPVDGVLRAALFDLGSPRVVTKPITSLDLTTALSAFELKQVDCYLCSAESSELLQNLLEVLKAAEIFGVCERVIEFTCEYVKTREQFGVPVGGFQAIQHKLADIYAATESLGAMVRFAAWSVERSPEQRQLTARVAISQAADLGPLVCEVAMQCHGGIGFTWEYDLHLFLRRAKTVQLAFPNSEARCDELLKVAARV